MNPKSNDLMNLMVRLFSLIFCFLFLQSSVFAQKEFNQLFFPKNKDARWLMSHWGKESNVKTLKKFNKKFDGEEDIDDFENSYTSYEYKFYVRLRSEKGKDEKYRYDGLFMQRPDNKRPPITFAGSTSQSEVLKKLSGYKNVEVVYNEDDKINLLFHPMKLFIEVWFFDKNTPGINTIIVSREGYGGYYEEQEQKKKELAIKELEDKAQQVLAETDFRFDKTSIKILPNQVRLYNPKEKDTYQIINILYKGPLKNGVPHGKGEWGILKGDFFPPELYTSKFKLILEGQFEEGQPVGKHVNNYGNYYSHVYEKGKLSKVYEEDGGKFSETYNSTGLVIEVSAMSFDYGTWIGLKYSGKVDENRQPHDPSGILSLGEGKEVKTHFEHGVLKLSLIHI